MRGPDEQQEWMFSCVSAEKRVPKDHPLRVIRTMVDVVLKDLSPVFEDLYARTGRLSIAPERLLRTLSTIIRKRTYLNSRRKRVQ
jgi:transposase